MFSSGFRSDFGMMSGSANFALHQICIRIYQFHNFLAHGSSLSKNGINYGFMFSVLRINTTRPASKRTSITPKNFFATRSFMRFRSMCTLLSSKISLLSFCQKSLISYLSLKIKNSRELNRHTRGTLTITGQGFSGNSLAKIEIAISRCSNAVLQVVIAYTLPFTCQLDIVTHL